MSSSAPTPAAGAWRPLAPPEPLSPAAKRALVAGMLGAHVLAGWGLLQVPAVRQAADEVAPILVEMIALRPAAPPPPPPPKPRPQTPPPAPVLAAQAVTPKPEPAFVAPPPPPELPPLPAPVAQPAPQAPPAPPAPPAPVPAAPRQVTLSDTDWVREPPCQHTLVSRRMRVYGDVTMRALFDTKGMARQVQVVKSSGHPVLDDIARGCIPGSRVKPRTENGLPFEFWATFVVGFDPP